MIRFLAQFVKEDVGSVLHIFLQPAGWPAPPGTVLAVAREDHYFGPPTFTYRYFLAVQP